MNKKSELETINQFENDVFKTKKNAKVKQLIWPSLIFQNMHNFAIYWNCIHSEDWLIRIGLI